MAVPRYSISSSRYLLAVSLLFVAVLNIPFFSRVFGYLWALSETHWLFILSVPIVVLAAFYFLLSLLLYPVIDRWLMAALILGSAIVSWMELNYGIIFDHTMIDNFAQTNAAEAKTYVSWGSILYVLILGVIPAIIASRARVIYAPLQREIFLRASGLALSLVVFSGLAGIFYKDFAAAGRNNQHVHQYLVPNQLIYSVAKFMYLELKGSGAPFQDLASNAHHNHHGDTPELFVLVLGETARAQEFSWNGYSRNTNPYTHDQGFVSLGPVAACGTATAVSVPCMFSFLDHSHYSRALANNQSNLLDAIEHSGFDVFWIDNNTGCKGVCNRIPHQQILPDSDASLCDGEYCYDEILLSHLRTFLERPLERDTMIVLHMIGSHGPTYYRRYPDAFRKYLPDCPRSDIQNCTQNEITNTYDNTITYSDYVLAETAKLLDDTNLPSSLLYISDHGESLGESGLYLHGMPMALAPKEQTSVPELIWFSAEFKDRFNINDVCMKAIANKGPHSQDELTHTVLGLLSVSLSAYSEGLDALRPCRV